MSSNSQDLDEDYSGYPYWENFEWDARLAKRFRSDERILRQQSLQIAYEADVRAHHFLGMRPPL